MLFGFPYRKNQMLMAHLKTKTKKKIKKGKISLGLQLLLYNIIKLGYIIQFKKLHSDSFFTA